MPVEKGLLFEVNGFKVYDNRVYYVKDKIDYDAPSGFEKAGVTKLPHDGVTDSFTIRFKQTGGAQSKEGVWDTGFYPSSPCFRNISESQATVLAKNNVKNVLVPYTKSTSISEDKLSHSSDNTWWDSKIMQLYSGKTFNTARPEERFELYFALLRDRLTPEGQEGNSKFKSSSYVVIDIESNKKRRDEKTELEFKAIGTFMGLMQTDKPGLIKLLDYVGLNVAETVNDSTLNSMFKTFIETSESKMKLYLAMVDEFDTKDGRAKIDIYHILRKKYPNGGVTRSKSGEFLYDGLEIGGDLKTAAQNIATRSEFKTIKEQLLLAD